MHLSICEEERVNRVLAALSSKVRRDILRMVDQQSYSIAEIAKELSIPMSNAVFHVKKLQEADIIHVQAKPASHGTTKIISRKIDEINLRCADSPYASETMSTLLDIPIGSYTDCAVSPSCGMASEEKLIDIDDTPGVFFSTERLKAQIIWFASGFLEYRVPNYFLKDNIPLGLTFSMEICSEAPNFRNDWESDITFEINGKEVCTWTSPGDFGGQRGRLNPAWWPDISTQYGLLKTVRIGEYGTYLDESRMSSVTLTDLKIEQGDFFTLRVGIKPDAGNIGGINLFGDKFGNYQQNILVRLEYKA